MREHCAKELAGTREARQRAAFDSFKREGAKYGGLARVAPANRYRFVY
jgi:hypothetical protein